MKRSVNVLMDILESINRIETYLGAVKYDEFLANQMLLDAVIRNLEIIGEAARNLSDEVKKKYPEVPWKNMIGLRNILIHEYFGIDESIVWEVATRNLKEVKPIIVRAIQEEGDFT
ncbi:HepT-like ribonuclease domain-containing protein [Paenibacillus sp. FSL K6-2441]|uniref:HepT-like ribonuclease domain-containing protein n=1 Tax=Paenibacillus TaxID=44249 RepID=UPI0030DC8C57